MGLLGVSENYKQASLYETTTDLGSVGVKILVSIDRTLNEEDDWLLRTKAEEIAKGLLAETNHLNPETKERREEERRLLLDCFPFPMRIFVEEIPNGYCSEWCCKERPWYVVTTPRGRIKIGWRKSVIQISWDGSEITQVPNELFPNENVTKFDRTIHAHGYEKAKQYLHTLMSREK
jgi:hypothetical protein